MSKKKQVQLINLIDMGNQSSDNGEIKLGYWGIRGRGQIMRLLLAYSGLKWTDCKYSSKQLYQKDCKQLGIPFPNLPYLIDGDYKLTESKAVALYIIHRSGKKQLLGKCIKDGGTVQCLIGVITDVRQAFSPLLFDKDWKSKTDGIVPKIVTKLDNLSKFYGDKCYGLGYLTLADFFISEYSYYIENIIPDVFNKYPFLKKVRSGIEDLPEIKKYYASQTALKTPFLPVWVTEIKF